MQGLSLFALAFLLLGQSTQQQQSVPDAPAPQAGSSSSLSDLKNEVTPGRATTPANNDDQPPPAQPAPPASNPPSATPQEAPQQEPPEIGHEEGKPFVLPPVGVNIVDVPVTVRDKKGALVPGLTWRDFRVYENKQRMNITYFSVDAVPLSVAFIIDQSLPSGTMQKVNQSLGAVAGAFTPYDEVAVYTYNNGPAKMTDFTGAQGNRLPAVLEASKRSGRDMGVPVNSGPLATGIEVNGKSIDPNLDRGNAGGIGGFMTVPKDVHTLNDAILFAAKDLGQRPRDRRRIIYVVSDGKESGSKATVKEVVRYLQSHNISVYGTLVGDSATWGYGYLDRLKLPLLPTNNVLPRYTVATGGWLDSEFQTDGMERSFSKIAGEVRTQYTIEYHSPSPTLDSRFRSIEVTMPNRPGYDITAKLGYYPTPVSSATH